MFENIEQFMIPIVVLAGFILGFFIKHTSFLKKFSSDIPFYAGLLGMILGPVIQGLSVESVVYGGISGLASVGVHQFLKKSLGLDNV